jgi:hypothetical protein
VVGSTEVMEFRCVGSSVAPVGSSLRVQLPRDETGAFNHDVLYLRGYGAWTDSVAFEPVDSSGVAVLADMCTLPHDADYHIETGPDRWSARSPIGIEYWWIRPQPCAGSWRIIMRSP